MYRINREENSISPLEQKSFSSLQFHERPHLQEWIAKRPAVLGEDLLIIQKEFAGFSDTLERLDLLAIDRSGSLVIIENKLDDAGRDVTWQAMKYASYCSGLTRDQIRTIFQLYLDHYDPGANAEERLCEFLDVDDLNDALLNVGLTQRIILVAANFRKEVTSTVLWLMNHGLRIKCVKTTAYSADGELFLSVDQIIPTREAEEYMIGLAAKAQDEAAGAEAQIGRNAVRIAFWTDLLAALRAQTELYANVSPSKLNWIAAGSGIRGVTLNLSATRSHARAEIYIDALEKEGNLAILEALEAQAEKMNRHLPHALEFERLDSRRACRVKCEIRCNVFNRDQWPTIIEFLVKAMVGMEKAFREQETTIRTVLAALATAQDDGEVEASSDWQAT